MVIDLLLLRSKGSVSLLQLERLDHILAAVEPQDQVITGRNAVLDPVCLLIEACKLICVFFIILLVKIFLEDIDLFLDR